MEGYVVSIGTGDAAHEVCDSELILLQADSVPFHAVLVTPV